MRKKNKFTLIIVFSAIGVIFSGYLSYYNYFITAGCSEAVITCGEKPIKIFGQPTCIYGFFMYLAVFLSAIFSVSKKGGIWIKKLIIWLAGLGFLFSGSLTVYELFFQKSSELPACAYGFIIYALILAFSLKRTAQGNKSIRTDVRSS